MTVSKSFEGLNCDFGTADSLCVNFTQLWLPAPFYRQTASQNARQARQKLKEGGLIF